MENSFLKPTTNLLKRTRGRPKAMRPEKDLGTQELQSKRQLLYGEQHAKVCQSSPSLDLLYHQGLLTAKQYEAGKYYYRLSQQALQGMMVRPKSTSCLANLEKGPHGGGFPGSAMISAYGIRKLNQWRRLERYLAGQDPNFPELLYQIIVRQQLKKSFFKGLRPSPQLHVLQKALETLYACLKTLSFKQNL